MLTKTEVGGTIHYRWRDEDRLDSLYGPGVSVKYQYDADGRRVKDSTGSTVHQYLIDPLLPYGQVVAETDGSNSLVAEYVYGQDRVSLRRSGAAHYYLADGQGSTRLLTDSTGFATDSTVYTAFGETLFSSGSTPNEFLYTGEQQNKSNNFYYNRAKWLDTKVGRFLGVDPFEGDPQSPLSLHRYLYTNASPASFTDPLGLSILTVFLNAARRFLPAHLVTATAFGKFAHTAIQKDIMRQDPTAIPEYTVNGGRVDIFLPPDEIYEIKPLGGLVSPDKQLARYIRDNPGLALGEVPFDGKIDPPTIPGISILYETVRPGVIEYEGKINRLGYSIMISGAAAYAATRATQYLVSEVGLAFLLSAY